MLEDNVWWMAGGFVTGVAITTLCYFALTSYYISLYKKFINQRGDEK